MDNDVEAANQLLSETTGSAERVLKLINEHGALIRKHEGTAHLYDRLVKFQTGYQGFLDDAELATGNMKCKIQIAKIKLGGKDFIQAYRDCSRFQIDPKLKKRARELQVEAKALHHDCQNALVFSEFEWWKILVAGLAGVGGLLLLVVATPLSLGAGIIIVGGITLGVMGLTAMSFYKTWEKTARGNDVLQQFIRELEIIEERLKKIPAGLSAMERAKRECDIFAEQYTQANDDLKEAYEAYLREKIDNLLESIERVDELVARGRAIE